MRGPSSTSISTGWSRCSNGHGPLRLSYCPVLRLSYHPLTIQLSYYPCLQLSFYHFGDFLSATASCDCLIADARSWVGWKVVLNWPNSKAHNLHSCINPVQHSPCHATVACHRARCTFDLIAVAFHDEYSISPSIQPICTRCCFTMTNMIQVCRNFH